MLASSESPSLDSYSSRTRRVNAGNTDNYGASGEAP